MNLKSFNKESVLKITKAPQKMIIYYTKDKFIICRENDLIYKQKSMIVKSMLPNNDKKIKYSDIRLISYINETSTYKS